MKRLLLFILSFLILSGFCGYSQNTAHDTISINNISARINNNGNLFWNLANQSEFFVPKNSIKTTIFNSTLWIGGLDSLDTLHLAGEEYEQTGHDYWSGPVSNVYDSAYDAKWNHVWKVTKADIDYHLAHCWQTGYIPSQALLNWPGNGDTSVGQAKIIAPFYDWNHDGIYNPYAGDYPLIKGDETRLFVMTDARNPHTESHGNKLGIDIVAMAYAFDCPSDSALENTLFLNYTIFNRSSHAFVKTYIGIFTDLDIGFADDDYIGCDVQRSSFYGYNGINIDGTGQSNAYGSHPPAQSVTFLAGPYMDFHGTDLPEFDQYGHPICDASVNGFGFGDGIPDNERFGLAKFVYFTNSNMGAPSYGSDPVNASDYYNYLRGIW